MIRAVIFDMDGVISDTQKLHARVESELLKRHGINLEPDEITRRYAGIPDEVFLSDISKIYGVSIDIEQFADEKWRLMIETAQEGVDPIPGALELIAMLWKAGFKLAVASSSIKAFIDTVLDILDIKRYFEAVVSVEDVLRGKPNPDIFLLAAKLMGVNPTDCVVIEDAVSGIKAAKKAGMKTILLAEEASHDVNPDITIRDLRELTIERLLSL
jgi:beta-phosphoglucomutase family hydrolase